MVERLGRAAPSCGVNIFTSPFLRRLVWSVVPAVMVVGALWMTLAGDDGLLNRHLLEQRLLARQELLRRLEAENVLLERRIRGLREDPDAVRREAARTLLAAEPGSTIYRFSD